MEYNNLIEILNKAGEELRTKYKAALKSGGVYSTGNLYNSIGYSIKVTESGVNLSFVALDYYLEIENGRKAGGKMPPLSVIRKWMISKNIPTKNGLDYVIARSISKKGIKPKPYLRDVRLGVMDNYRQEIMKALKADTLESIKTKLKSNGDNN